MGITFTKAMGAQPLAPKLLEKCEEALKRYEKMLAKNVNRHMIFQYINKKLISTVNYGAFYDDPDQKPIY
ncbi:MAG: hypothetical protein EOM41_12320 [Bacilli bacterium]|jgi:hypothetical protein|nr:hypothetical protein [Bacilli bacterium]